ncbi:MAG: hypothetical protein VYC44_11475, partial [Chloroflexota bacterium]|nr:hypothetical protein [Chloroflexota bacterium]
MDTYYLPQSIIFLVFATLFSYVSLLRLGQPVRASSSDEDTSFLSEPFLFWLKVGCLFPATISGGALIHGFATTDWWLIAAMCAGLLFGFFLIERGADKIGKRYPRVSRPWSQTTITIGSAALVLNGQLSSGNENGNGPGFTQEELEEPAITEDELISLDDRDREMLRSIIRLDATTVREVMVPRLDM